MSAQEQEDWMKDVGINHQAWLMQPMTKTLKYILQKHEERLADAIANASGDLNLPDTHVRQLAVQLKTTKTIKNLIYDTPTFVAKSR